MVSEKKQIPTLISTILEFILPQTEVEYMQAL